MAGETKSDRVRIVLSTFASGDEARSVAETVVSEKLAACVNLLPGVSSIYRWEGEVRNESEILAVIKTTREAVPKLSARIRELHSYDTPEIISIEPSHVSERYGAWVVGEVAL